MNLIRRIIAWKNNDIIFYLFFQLIGFAVLLVGMALYNDLLIMPMIRDYRAKKKEAN